MPLLVEYSTFRLSLPSPFHARNSRPSRDARLGLRGLVSGRTTLPVNPEMELPETATCATFKLSLPSPFQVMWRLLLCTISPGDCGLVSVDTNLFPKVAPLSAEYMMFSLSLP